MAQRAAQQDREALLAGSGQEEAETGSSSAQVLDQITERITGRLREEIRQEVIREEKDLLARRDREKQEQQGRLEGFLAAELEQTTCPVCYELMLAPIHTPTLLFPCGHTFCVQCLDAHIAKNRSTCPFCRNDIQSRAPNVLMQQLIDGYIQKKGLVATRAAATEAAAESSGISGFQDCDGDLDDYRRQWRTISMRYRIYENEEKDCAKDIQALAGKLEASKLVKKHLLDEQSETEKRLKALQAELELIQDQLAHQTEKQAALEDDIAEKHRRLDMVSATKNSLKDDRSKIILVVSHMLHGESQAEAFLEGQDNSTEL